MAGVLTPFNGGFGGNFLTREGCAGLAGTGGEESAVGSTDCAPELPEVVDVALSLFSPVANGIFGIDGRFGNTLGCLLGW